MLQELMGHADVKTTEMYTHVMDKESGYKNKTQDATALQYTHQVHQVENCVSKYIVPTQSVGTRF